MSEQALVAGITPAGAGQDGVAWNVLGHRYWLKAESAGCFCFETLDPPGTFVPLHVHPRQDEFIYVLEGTFDLQLGEAQAAGAAGRSRAHADGHPARLLQQRRRAWPRAVLGQSRGPPQGAVRSPARPHRHRRGDPHLRAARGRLRHLSRHACTAEILAPGSRPSSPAARACLSARPVALSRRVDREKLLDVPAAPPVA